jgi:hypothetical protein
MTTNKTFLKQILIFALGNITVFLHTGSKAQPALPKPKQFKSINNNNITDTNHIARSRFNYLIIDEPHDTYGYDIYDDNHKLIHQPSIPGCREMMDLKQKQML